MTFGRTLCFFLFILMLFHSNTAQTQRNITLGSSLTAKTNGLLWESPSGEFVFGFQEIRKDGFLLAIWFNKIPQKTIVWSVNGNSLVQQGSMVELTRTGSLVLKDSTGRQIWSTADVTGTGVAYAAMLDTGNFVLANREFVNLWESFNEPTDTLLQQQTLAQGTKLVARYSEANYSRGRFHLILQSNGNLELYTRTFPLDGANFRYWQSDTGGTSGSGSRLIFNQSGFVYLEANNGSVLNMLSSKASSTQDFYQRVILEHDGVFRHYVYPKRDDSSSWGWNLTWTQSSTSIPSNICTSIQGGTGSGACGFNSYCSIGDDLRPICNCPNGYTFIDPEDPIQGCKQSFEAQRCGEDLLEADLFSFHSMENTDFPYSDYEHLQPVTEDWCRKACLSDCFCAAVFYSNGDCFKKQSPLSNGRIGLENSGKSLIKIRKDNSTSKLGDTDSKQKVDSTLVITGSVLLSSSVLLNILLLSAALLSFFHFKRKPKATTALLSFFRFKRKPKATTEPNQGMQNMNLQTFTYEELDKATNGFKEQLGRGAFGTVFRGALETEDRTLVAVKKLDNMVREGEQEFNAEVNAIGRSNHKNLVQLVGFCSEGRHRLLVYEFMTNGSLASFLFGPSRPNWHHRMQIALEIARGLFYLHEGCSTQIIHCDIKPQNVLLDDCFTARISDFGLAKILKMDQTRTTTEIRGTKGYVAPEWFRNMPVTAKVDVYSYGILLLESTCCRKNYEAEAEDENQMILSDWAYDCYASGKLKHLVENDEEAMEDMKRVEKFVMVAIWCIQEDPSLRPTMKKVTLMLEGTVEVSVPPDPISYISSL